MKKYLLPLLLIIVSASCQKEVSFEDGGVPVPPDPSNPPIGANCKVKQILLIDPASKTGLYSILTNFSPDGTATRVEIYDSIATTVDFESIPEYKGDTVKVSANEYFILDAQKRVKSYTTFDNSGPVTDTVSFIFTYNGDGYLQKKEGFIQGIPLPVVRFTYTWSGGNLVAVNGAVAVPGVTQKVLDATLEYDGTKTAKNFIQVLPDGLETALYVMALNLGKVAKNVVKKISVTTYDENGSLDETYVSTYSDYKFSSDGYLTEWTAAGDLLGGSPFVEGRSVFNYFCR